MLCRTRTFITPLLTLQQYPEITLTRHTKKFNPTIKIGKERFEVTLDLRHFNQDEITVKAHPEYVLIEGKQERETSDGYVVKEFVKKFRLPEGCIIKEMESRLSPEGILTVSAPRTCISPDIANFIVIPIVPEGRKSEGKVKKVSQGLPNPCKKYPKVKPKQK